LYASSSTYKVRAPPATAHEVHVLIPSSYAKDAAHLREKTLRIGFLFRAMAIFRVSRMIIYDEDPANPEEEAELLKLICEYMSTPPYLRRRVYRIQPELRYVGLLPPLNIYTHPPSMRPPSEEWEVREALVERRGEVTILHAGLRRPIVTEARRRSGSRVLLLVREHRGKIRYRLLKRGALPFFMGTKVLIHRGRLADILAGYRYRIATDRDGESISTAWYRIAGALRRAGGPVCIAFGSYKRGLGEIAELHDSRLEDLFDVCLNFIPSQGVRSVRTEEAVYCVLSILNALSMMEV